MLGGVARTSPKPRSLRSLGFAPGDSFYGRAHPRDCNALLYCVKCFLVVRGERHTLLTKAAIAGGVLASVLVVVLFLAAGYRALKQALDQWKESEVTATNLPPAETTSGESQGFIFGRITTGDGTIYEGRLRFDRNEEAFWGDYFSGWKAKNPWVAQLPTEKLTERRPVTIFGVEVFQFEREIDVGRPFMARFGDITRFESNGRDLRVTFKSGTRFNLDHFASDDLGDGVRVWDGKRGVVNLDKEQIRAIDLLPTVEADAVPVHLHGTVRTRSGDFTGFIHWNRKKGVGSDELVGQTADRKLSLRFDSLRSITRQSTNSSLVTTIDGKEIVLTDIPDDVGAGNRGVYVDDRRYGRVLVSWNAFERIDFSPGGGGPAYGDFPAGRPLSGDVTTRDGRHLVGRLVYDLDESETTETLDASSGGVDYNIPSGLIDSIVLATGKERGTDRPTVTLHNGEMLRLDSVGDLGEGNAGVLIFVEGRKQPEYVLWTDIKQIHFDRPPAMYPPLERH